MTRDRLQEGIYFRTGERSPPAYRLLLLDARAGAQAAEVAAALEAVITMLRALRRGDVRDLPGAKRRASAVQFEGLTALLGYGASLFARGVTDAERPEHLVPLAGFPALPWEREGTGEAGIAIQLTAERRTAGDVAAVEVAQLLADEGHPLEIVASFDGFGRADGRGWLGFHDGVSNMRSEDRLEAIAAPADPPWMRGGTYMAFLRLRVDLVRWRALSRAEQELAVGRDKLTGAALVAVDRRGRPVAKGGFVIDPPQTTDPRLEASHIHRANQSRASPHAPAALRIFRQGYDFLDAVGPGPPRVGLNFVSFQSSLGTLQHLLHLPGWLGDANFGGTPGPSFVTLQAGGLYAVPPRTRPFPGAGLFG